MSLIPIPISREDAIKKYGLVQNFSFYVKCKTAVIDYSNKFYIDKYWSVKYQSWIDGYKIGNIYYLRLSQFLFGSRYKITKRLPDKFNIIQTDKPKWDNGEFENFLKSIRL